MATCHSEETEDFITCSICLHEFNKQQRCPKYLPCCHTLCLECIQKIRESWTVACPLCRLKFQCLDANLLTTNSYALHLIEIKASYQVPKVSRFSNWCLTCGCLPKITCSGKHRTVSIDSGDVNEAQEIQKLFNQCTTLLAENVEKRRVIQNRLNRVLKPLEAMEDELRKQLEDNDFHLAKMMSRLEDIDLDSSKLNSRENFVKCLEEAQEEGQKITDIMSGFEKNKETLTDSESMQWADDELAMLWHVMSYIQLKKGKVEPETGTLKKSGSNNISDDTATALSQPSTPLLSHFKSSAASRIVLKFARGHIIFGQVEIQPEMSNQSFIQEIGAYYFRNCKRIGKMQKAVKGQYLSLVIEDPNFQPSSPSNLVPSPIQNPFDVCITKYQERSGKVQSWGLTFFLVAPVPVEQQSVKKAFVFGRIFKGGEVLVKLSFLTTAERADVDVYVEAI